MKAQHTHVEGELLDLLLFVAPTVPAETMALSFPVSLFWKWGGGSGMSASKD